MLKCHYLFVRKYHSSSNNNNNNNNMWTPHFARSMRFPLDGELDFYFKKIDFY